MWYEYFCVIFFLPYLIFKKSLLKKSYIVDCVLVLSEPHTPGIWPCNSSALQSWCCLATWHLWCLVTWCHVEVEKGRWHGHESARPQVPHSDTKGLSHFNSMYSEEQLTFEERIIWIGDPDLSISLGRKKNILLRSPWLLIIILKYFIIESQGMYFFLDNFWRLQNVLKYISHPDPFPTNGWAGMWIRQICQAQLLRFIMRLLLEREKREREKCKWTWQFLE